MHRPLLRLGVSALSSLVALAPAAAATWEIDPSHSSAQFSVRHLTVSNVRGEFGKIAGSVEFDGKDVRTIKVDATIDAASIDTREPKRDEHLRSADFLDVAKYPTITFRSKRAEPAVAGRFKLVGDLTIRGVTREAVLDVEGPTPEIKDPWGNVKRGATATTRINRIDYGVKWNAVLDAGGVVVGEEVAITIDLELIREASEAAASK